MKQVKFRSVRGYSLILSIQLSSLLRWRRHLSITGGTATAAPPDSNGRCISTLEGSPICQQGHSVMPNYSENYGDILVYVKKSCIFAPTLHGRCVSLTSATEGLRLVILIGREGCIHPTSI